MDINEKLIGLSERELRTVVFALNHLHRNYGQYSKDYDSWQDDQDCLNLHELCALHERLSMKVSEAERYSDW
jgi:hypothetical protein